MSEYIAVILLGIIEGITEFIPVSSTAHLLIAEHWIAKHSDLFNIVIQSGAVIAVIPLFHRRFHQFIFRLSEPTTRDYLLKIFVAFAITGVGGLILDRYNFKLPDPKNLKEIMPVAIAIFVGGVLFIAVEQWLRKSEPKSYVTWSVAFAVGIGQLIAAAFPGTSRSGATILLALLLGLNRPAATEFSFLVGIPTMLAAGGLKIFKALHHAAEPHEPWEFVLIGTIVSAIVSFIAVKWLLRYVQTHTFTAFGWYRIALGLVIFIFLLR